MKKHLLPLVLFCLLSVFLTSVPVSAATKSGTVGGSVRWSLDGGKLTFSGAGSIPDYSSMPPWFPYRNSITSLEMESGITGIGSKALAGLSSLRRAVLPNGLRAIGQASFFQCTRLSEITIPASVTSISKAAFGECPALRVVHYGGTQTQWRSMYIGGGNDNLTSASIQYNSGETPSSNVSWTLDAQGVMRVSGTGAMPDYGVGNPSPWSARSYSI